MSHLTIRWEPSTFAQNGEGLGHGFCIYAAPIDRRDRIVAFVEGFAWLHGSDEAVVTFDPQAVP